MSQPMNCNEFVELVTEYLEDAMPPENRRRFEEHLESCHGCTHYLQQMRQTIALTGKLTEADINDQAQQDLLHAFRDWKSEGKD